MPREMMIVTFDRVVRESDSGLALLLDFGGGTKEWFPKSQLEQLEEAPVREKSSMVLAPKWLVLEKGLEAYAEEWD